jgi:hypothetical protein
MEFGPRQIITHVIAPLAAMTLLAGCTPGEHPAAPERPPAAVPAIPTTEGYEPPTDAQLCAGPFKPIGRFAPDATVAADEGRDYAAGYTYGTGELNDQEVATLTADIRRNLNLPVKFPDAVTETQQYEMESISANPDLQKAAEAASLIALAQASQYYSADVLRALNLSSISFVSNITKRPGAEAGLINRPGGLYDDTLRTIFINVQIQGGKVADLVELIQHEIWHVIEHRLLCNATDYAKDDAFSRYNTIDYQPIKPDGTLQIDPKYTLPGKERVFVSPYGASAIYEDRATTIQWTLGERGLILEGDPDYDSPLAHKQAELVRRIEAISPGFTDFLMQRTLFFRAGLDGHPTVPYPMGAHTELDEYLQTALYPGKFVPAEVTITNAITDHKSVRMLTHGIVEIKNPLTGSTRVVKNPILLPGVDGSIAGVAWATDDSGLQAYAFDPNLMKLRYSGSSPNLVSGEMKPKLAQSRISDYIAGLQVGRDVTEAAGDFTPDALAPVDSDYMGVLTRAG